MSKEEVNFNYGYDNKGAFFKLEIHVPYNELKTFKLPQSCSNCPCGYMSHKCGRNVPFTDEDDIKRSEKCRLQKISVEDYIKKYFKYEL